MTELRLVPGAGTLDAEIGAKLRTARSEWAGIGANMLMVEGRKTDTERFELIRELEARATALSITFDELALLVERREEEHDHDQDPAPRKRKRVSYRSGKRYDRT